MDSLPPPNPAKNPCGYTDGRSCYDVEQEVLALVNLIHAPLLIFLRAWWRLRWLQFRYALDIPEILARYDRYYELQELRSVID